MAGRAEGAEKPGVPGSGTVASLPDPQSQHLGCSSSPEAASSDSISALANELAIDLQVDDVLARLNADYIRTVEARAQLDAENSQLEYQDQLESAGYVQLGALSDDEDGMNDENTPPNDAQAPASESGDEDLQTGETENGLAYSSFDEDMNGWPNETADSNGIHLDEGAEFGNGRHHEEDMDSQDPSSDNEASDEWTADFAHVEPLPAGHVETIREVMASISLRAPPPQWAQVVPEPEWIQRLLRNSAATAHSMAGGGALHAPGLCPHCGFSLYHYAGQPCRIAGKPAHPQWLGPPPPSFADANSE
eukprot:6212739-Pleurochrysis_carterae.AAC.3